MRFKRFFTTFTILKLKLSLFSVIVANYIAFHHFASSEAYENPYYSLISLAFSFTFTTVMLVCFLIVSYIEHALPRQYESKDKWQESENFSLSRISRSWIKFLLKPHCKAHENRQYSYISKR